MSDTAQQHIEGNTDSGLPEGWTLAKLGDLCTHPQYGWTTSADKNGTGLRLLRTTDISSGTVNWSTVPACAQDPDDPQKYLLAPGDILVSRAGSVGLSHLVKECPKAIFASYLIRFRPKPPLESDFIALFLRSPQYWVAIADQTSGIAIPNVNASKLKQLEVLLPPLPEQKRIVTKVEELLTRVNATKDRLSKVSTILKRFRQSVLAAACSGRLTTDWRENQNVLKEIGNIQDELSNMLPESWTRAKLSQVTKINMGQSPPGSSYNERGDGLPFFQGKADFGDRYPTVRVWCNEPKKIAQPGDVLITIRAPVGPTNVANKICAIGRGLAAISPKEGMTSEFILFALRLKEPELALSGTGSTFTAIKRKDLEQIDINVPPITEQHEIVRRVESMFKLADAVKKRVAAAKVRSDKLTQAILAKAFRGELVPTEAELASREARSYEPASELLARIKSERDSNGALQKAPQVRGHKKRSK